MSAIGNIPGDPGASALAVQSAKAASADVQAAAAVKAQKVSMKMEEMAASVIEGSLENLAPPGHLDVHA